MGAKMEEHASEIIDITYCAATIPKRSGAVTIAIELEIEHSFSLA